MQTQPQKKASAKIVIGLLLVHLVFSTVTIAVKYTSMQEMLSMQYFIGLGIVILILGTYAIVWQQVLKRVDITLAYMFKATGIIFVLLYSAFLFKEPITTWNIIGAAIIVTGITLFVKS